MNVRHLVVTCVVLLCSLVLCAACTSTNAPGPAPALIPTAIPSDTHVAGGTATLVSPTPPVTAGQNSSPVLTTTPVPVPMTWITKTYGEDAVIIPQIALLTFVKGAMTYDIPDCGMRVAFPQAAGDPAYGIRQPVPKLVMLTPEEIDSFEKTYSTHPGIYPDMEPFIDPNRIGGAQCTGIPADPRWNFVRINATLIPRNARPGEYDIGINIRSQGNVIEQLRMNRTFIIDQPVIVVRYIPLKLEEMDAFDSIGLVFFRRNETVST